MGNCLERLFSTDMINEKKKISHSIQSLNGIRVIMILIVFVSHMEFLTNYSYGLFYSKYLHNAVLGVDYFFMLSGFGMMYSKLVNNVKIEPDIKNCIEYAIRKVKKIYPLYIGLIVICIPSFIINCIEYGRSYFYIIITGVIKFIFCILMIQSLFGNQSLSHAFNGVNWFLSSLFLISIIAPIYIKIINRIKRISRLFLMLVCAVFITIIVYIIFGYLDGNFFFNTLQYESPIIRSFYVVIGMICAKINLSFQGRLTNRYKTKVFFSGVEIILLLMSLMWFLCRNSIRKSFLACIVIDLLLCASIIIFYSFEMGAISKLLSRKIFRKTSGLVMYFFLVHYPVRIYVDLLFQNITQYGKEPWIGVIEVFLVFLISFFATISISLFCKHNNIKDFLHKRQ